jgi:hypothetical protein
VVILPLCCGWQISVKSIGEDSCAREFPKPVIQQSDIHAGRNKVLLSAVLPMKKRAPSNIAKPVAPVWMAAAMTMIAQPRMMHAVKLLDVMNWQNNSI